jgi:hypothetical protein
LFSQSRELTFSRNSSGLSKGLSNAGSEIAMLSTFATCDAAPTICFTSSAKEARVAAQECQMTVPVTRPTFAMPSGS